MLAKTILLSHVLSQNTPSYGNRDKIFIRVNSSIEKGESANSSCWIFSNNHIGTHIDTPRHFSITGYKTADIPVSDFFFNHVALLDIPCSNGRLIGSMDISDKEIPPETELLLIRTGYEQFRNSEKYWNDSPGLTAELADYFRKNYPSIRCVGFDFISLTSWNFREEGRKSHCAFLCPSSTEKSILIVEDMALALVSDTVEQVIIAPLIMEDGNGGPVTVIARMS